jgi:hypothetical protein
MYATAGVLFENLWAAADMLMLLHVEVCAVVLAWRSGPASTLLGNKVVVAARHLSFFPERDCQVLRWPISYPLSLACVVVWLPVRICEVCVSFTAAWLPDCEPPPFSPALPCHLSQVNSVPLG